MSGVVCTTNLGGPCLLFCSGRGHGAHPWMAFASKPAVSVAKGFWCHSFQSPAVDVRRFVVGGGCDSGSTLVEWEC